MAVTDVRAVLLRVTSEQAKMMVTAANRFVLLEQNTFIQRHGADFLERGFAADETGRCVAAMELLVKLHDEVSRVFPDANDQRQEAEK